MQPFLRAQPSSQARRFRWTVPGRKDTVGSHVRVGRQAETDEARLHLVERRPDLGPGRLVGEIGVDLRVEGVALVARVAAAGAEVVEPVEADAEGEGLGERRAGDEAERRPLLRGVVDRVAAGDRPDAAGLPCGEPGGATTARPAVAVSDCSRRRRVVIGASSRGVGDRSIGSRRTHPPQAPMGTSVPGELTRGRYTRSRGCRPMSQATSTSPYRFYQEILLIVLAQFVAVDVPGRSRFSTRAGASACRPGDGCFGRHLEPGQSRRPARPSRPGPAGARGRPAARGQLPSPTPPSCCPSPGLPPARGVALARAIVSATGYSGVGIGLFPSRLGCARIRGTQSA